MKMLLEVEVETGTDDPVRSAQIASLVIRKIPSDFASDDDFADDVFDIDEDAFDNFSVTVKEP